MISVRAAEVKDRAVPGHWEGDLSFGKKMTSIGTLVERHSRYVILLKPPTAMGPRPREGHDQAHLDCRPSCAAPSPGTRTRRWPSTSTSPSTRVCRSISATPKSPWQRGSNESTNGLLRQYLPRSSDLSRCTQRQLDAVARSFSTSLDRRSAG